MKEMEYQVTETCLTIIGQDGTANRRTFPWPIAQVLAFTGILVVRIEPPQGICFNENVYGILPSGAIAWQVEPRKYVYDDSPYTGLVRSGDEVKLMNWDGLELLVDPGTGKEISERYGR